MPANSLLTDIGSVYCAGLILALIFALCGMNVPLALLPVFVTVICGLMIWSPGESGVRERAVGLLTLSVVTTATAAVIALAPRYGIIVVVLVAIGTAFWPAQMIENGLNHHGTTLFKGLRDGRIRMLAVRGYFFAAPIAAGYVLGTARAFDVLHLGPFELSSAAFVLFVAAGAQVALAFLLDQCIAPLPQGSGDPEKEGASFA